MPTRRVTLLLFLCLLALSQVPQPSLGRKVPQDQAEQKAREEQQMQDQLELQVGWGHQ